MASQLELSTVLLVAKIIISLVSLVVSEPQVPCYFIFGDSLVDNGNNNYIASFARADYLPYGIDFPAGPTGRFCNGMTTVDVLAEQLGFQYFIPPYASSTRESLLSGANFASAAAGLREETGRQLGGRITFAGQVQNYRSAVQQIMGIFGDQGRTAYHLSRCLYTVGMGSNDYLNNYFMPQFYDTGLRYTPEEFANDLIQRYADQLRALYNYGARKVALIGVGQVGCAPNELAQHSPNGITCDNNINSAIQIFNNKIISMVNQFNRLPGAHFTYINSYGIFRDLVRNHDAHGIRNTNSGCCGVGRNNGQITCLPYQTPCANRNEYLFWDAFHPSEIANIIVGQRFYSSQSPDDAYPMDIRRLVQL